VLVKGKHDYASFEKTIKNPYLTIEQYPSILAQCREWMKLYGIKDVKRHSDVSPGRKIDPGSGFPWRTFLNDLHKHKEKT